MITVELHHIQHSIIRDICDIQIQSLLRLASDPDVPNTLRAIGVDVEDSQINYEIVKMMMDFDNLKLQPNKVLTLDNINISIIKHILLNEEQRYSRGEFPKYRANLWRKLFLRDDIINRFN